MLPLLLGLLLIALSSVVEMRGIVRTSEAPVALRGGAVMAWMVGTLAVGVLPAFAAFALLNLATGVVRLDGGLAQLGAATLWVGLCDVAKIGRLVSPPPEERGTEADHTRDRTRLFAAAALAAVAYAAALLIAVGFVDDGHVAPGVAVALGVVAAAATVRSRPGGPGMGPLTRRPVDPDAADDGTAPDDRAPAPPDDVGDDPRGEGEDAETHDAGRTVRRIGAASDAERTVGRPCSGAFGGPTAWTSAGRPSPSGAGSSAA